MTPKPRFRGFVLDHQVVNELKLKESKTVVFDQFLTGFWILVLLKLDG